MSDALSYLRILDEASKAMHDAIWDEYNRVSKSCVDLEAIASRVDNASARALENYLIERDFRPRVVSEEGFTNYTARDNLLLIVDPLDGTSNFVRGVPFSTVSLAVSRGDTLEDVFVGLVRDLFRNEVYYAIRGRGAFTGSRRIRVRRAVDPSKAYVSICINRLRPGVSKELNILPYVSYSRHFGSASLEGVYVALGRIDAHIDLRGVLRVFDIAASHLIVREAGGISLVWQNGRRQVRISDVHGISIFEAATAELAAGLANIIGFEALKPQ